MELENSICDWVLQHLPHDRNDPEIVEALNTKRAGELLVLYLNWQHRLIEKRPRQLFFSSSFDHHPHRWERSEAIEQIFSDIVEGKDLTKYLSRRICFGFTVPPKPETKQLGKLRHLDLLLNDWDIHHLHLSTRVESDGFVERADPLLFAIFRSDRAYVLDIGTHQDFSHDRLVKIAVDNWPYDNLFLKIQSLQGIRNKGYTTQERSQLRKAGLATMIQIDNEIYFPPGGISTAGTSTQVSRRANVILRTLRAFDEQISNDPSGLAAKLREFGCQPAEKLEFRFAMFAEGFGVVEKTTDAPIRLG